MRQSQKKTGRSKSDYPRNPSSERQRNIREPLITHNDEQSDEYPDNSIFVPIKQSKAKKVDSRTLQNLYAINDSNREQEGRVVTHKSRITGSRVQSKQHMDQFYAPALSETTEGAEPRYFTDQKRVLHHAELKENLNELHLSGQVNNQIEKEVQAKEEDIYNGPYCYDEQELEHEEIQMNYPAKEVEKMVNAFKGKIPDLKQKQITQYLENYKNIQGKHRTPDFKVCVHIHGNEINFVHSSHYVVVHEDEIRLVTIGTVLARTRYDSAGYKLYLLMHRIYFEPRCAISREPIYQTELTSFENDKFIDTRCKFFYQVAEHLYFYKVVTHIEDDFNQHVQLIKINFIDDKVVPVQLPEYSFTYKLADDERAKHNLVSHVIFQSNIKYCSRIPSRQQKEMDDEYSTEEELKEQIVQIAYDAKVDNINSKLGVAYAFSRIKDAGALIKINNKANIKHNQGKKQTKKDKFKQLVNTQIKVNHGKAQPMPVGNENMVSKEDGKLPDTSYFYEIQNQRDQEGEPKLNFSFFGKVKRGSDEFCWISNGYLLKKFKVQKVEEKVKIVRDNSQLDVQKDDQNEFQTIQYEQIQEIKDKKELDRLETGIKGDFKLSDKVQHTIKYQNQQIVKILELQQTQQQMNEQKESLWRQSTFNWHTNKEYFYKQAQHPDLEHEQDDEYMQYFDELEEDIGMKKTEGKKGIPLKLSPMNTIFLIELFDQNQFCVISKQHNPDGDEFIQIRRFEEIDQDIYISEENNKIQGHPFVKMLTLDNQMNLNQVKSSCGNVFVRLKDKQIVQADRDYNELTALGHVTHQDEATDIPSSLQRFRENNQMIKPIAQTYNIPFIQIKEHILIEEEQEHGCITKKKKALQRPVITFLDKNMQVLTKQEDGRTQDFMEMLNIYNIDFNSAKQIKRMKQALSSHVYFFAGEYVQHFQVINKINNDGLCWYIIQEFMYNIEGNPNPRLIALKVLLTDLEKQGHMYFAPLYEGIDLESYNSFVCGTQVFYKKNKESEISIKMKNLESDEYQIRNEVSSNSYKSYILYDQEHLDRSEDKTKYLIVEARVSEAMKENIGKVYKKGDTDNVKFTQNEVFSILWNQVTITLNMYPLQGLDSQLFGDLKHKDQFDIFQPLELLRGKSLSCLMIQDANWFNHQLERIRKAQKCDHCSSLVDDYTNDKQEMREQMQSLDLIRQPYDIVKDLQDESILITCLCNEETSQTFKLLIDYIFDSQKRSQGGYTILMQTITYIMNRDEFDIEYPSSYMRFFNDGEQYNIAVKIDNLDGIMPEYIGTHEEMINYEPIYSSLYLRYIGEHKPSRDDLCHAVKHHLQGSVPREAVDHTVIDFGLIETHAKIKKLKNKSETVMDKMKNSIISNVNIFNDSLAQDLGFSEAIEMRNFPLNEFENEFPFIDRYAISTIAWKFNCFYSDQIETQQSMKAIIRHMYIRTRKFIMIQGICFAIFFVVPFFYQLNTLDYEHSDVHGKVKIHSTTQFCMWICMIYQIAQSFMSLLLIKAGGWKFFGDPKNNADILMVILFTTYFTLANEFSNNMVIDYDQEMTTTDCWISCLLVAILFIMFYQFTKLCEIFPTFSLFTRMFRRCIVDVVPFTIFLIIWNLFFSISYRLMGVVIADSRFPNLVPFFSFFTQSFENSMGAISTPTLQTSNYTKNYGQGMIHIVWFIWFANQFVVTIILMNLLIAVLCDTYANITSNQSQIRFNEEATMNRDYYHLSHSVKLFKSQQNDEHYHVSLLSFKIEPKSMNEWAGVSSKIVGEIRIKFDSLLKHVLKIKREQQDQSGKQEKNNETFKKEVLQMLHSIKEKQEDQDQQLERVRTLQSQNTQMSYQSIQTHDFDQERMQTRVIPQEENNVETHDFDLERIQTRVIPQGGNEVGQTTFVNFEDEEEFERQQTRAVPRRPNDEAGTFVDFDDEEDTTSVHD